MAVSGRTKRPVFVNWEMGAFLSPALRAVSGPEVGTFTCSFSTPKANPCGHGPTERWARIMVSRARPTKVGRSLPVRYPSAHGVDMISS